MTKSAPAIIDAIGIYGLFAIFSAVAFLAGVNAAIFMPETKGLSLKEVKMIYDYSERKLSPGTNIIKLYFQNIVLIFAQLLSCKLILTTLKVRYLTRNLPYVRL